ncbi:MAG: dipeptidase [Pseudomonadota bacterium]
MSHIDPVLDHIDAELPVALERLKALLRIKSISTDSAFRDDCRAAADWLVASLNEMGFEASRRDTPGHPMVVAHRHGANENVPHLLFYGHYDVQPVDPLDLWHSDPFDPQIEQTAGGSVIRARGAADDKGQLMTFVEACRAYLAVHGELPVRLTVFFEGEEESGSPSLVPFLEANKDELTADLALVCDTGMWDADTPAVTTMLRGMVSAEITVNAADIDLHSGMFGGPAANPIKLLSKAIAALHDDTGRVTLPGFYDGVADIDPDIAAQWRALNHDEAAFLGAVGLAEPAGERGYSALEQIWARPTLEVNGIWGGYTGEGFKTVLPAQAHAKVSCRLVGLQDPAKIAEALSAHFRAAVPGDCSVDIVRHSGAGATVMPVTSDAFTRARDALTAEWPNPAVFAGCGGSIPVVGHFRSVLGMDSLLTGFGLDDDAIHSPNEKYSVTSFHKGARSWARILCALAPD